MREEIVSNEEDEEDPIVYGSFEVEGDAGDLQLYFEVLAEGRDVQEDEGPACAKDRAGRSAYCAVRSRSAPRSVPR